MGEKGRKGNKRKKGEGGKGEEGTVKKGKGEGCVMVFGEMNAFGVLCPPRKAKANLHPHLQNRYTAHVSELSINCVGPGASPGQKMWGGHVW